MLPFVFLLILTAAVVLARVLPKEKSSCRDTVQRQVVKVYFSRGESKRTKYMYLPE